MSNLVALTNIRHGNVDGTLTEVLIGQSVDALPQDVVDGFVAAGLVGVGTPEIAAAAPVVDAEVKEAEEE